MHEHLIIGVAALAIGLALIVIALPRSGVSPRFLRFRAATVVYPPVIMIFLVLGVAEIVSAL